MNIVFLDRDTLSPQTRLRPPTFTHRLVCHGSTAPDEVAERIADADIVLVNKVRIDAPSLSGARRLKLIAVAATGTDNIDLAACRARGITVSNIRNYAVNTVPEHTFALIFALRRSICAYRDAVRAGRWQASGQFCFFDHPIRDLAGSSLGVIGDGVLGQAVAALGRALGMRVLMSAFKGRDDMGVLYTPFERVLAESDVITLHCPLLPQTRHMIGATEFAAMRRKPLLINTARGGLVDESAVGPALEAGRIVGAGFDVTVGEPPAPDHPFMRLLDRPDFILTPHVAWASDEAIQALADQLIDNVEAFERGTPTCQCGGGLTNHGNTALVVCFWPDARARQSKFAPRRHRARGSTLVLGQPSYRQIDILTDLAIVPNRPAATLVEMSAMRLHYQRESATY